MYIVCQNGWKKINVFLKKAKMTRRPPAQISRGSFHAAWQVAVIGWAMIDRDKCVITALQAYSCNLTHRVQSPHGVTSKHETFAQRLLIVVPALHTMAQPWAAIGWTSRVFWIAVRLVQLWAIVCDIGTVLSRCSWLSARTIDRDDSGIHHQPSYH